MQTTITGGTGSLAQHVQDDLAGLHDLVLPLEMKPIPPNEDEERGVDASIERAKRELADYLTETKR